ncbi:hypothetical protein [Nonomuraea fuscirosea]|uniref:hypothetical protein n=1 Tax=Nonomuraea fuscirosea TaxID=1291556 RepID=UPI0034016DFE
MASFIGLRRWAPGPEVEFVTDEGLVDLHNLAEIERLTISPGSSTLTIGFAYYGDWRATGVQPHSVELEFGGIRSLKMELPADYEPRAETSLEGIFYQDISGQTRFDIDMDEIQCSLVAETLTLRDV